MNTLLRDLRMVLVVGLGVALGLGGAWLLVRRDVEEQLYRAAHGAVPDWPQSMEMCGEHSPCHIIVERGEIRVEGGEIKISARPRYPSSYLNYPAENAPPETGYGGLVRGAAE